MKAIALMALALAAPNNVATARLGQDVRIGSTHIRPLKVIEDSRCPTRVTCVWAGRLVVRARVRGPHFNRIRDFELSGGRPAGHGGGLQLIAATPLPERGGGVPPSSYRLTFEMAR